MTARRVRVLMLIDRLRDGGGAERFVMGLSRSLPRDRYDVRVCTTREGRGRITSVLAASEIPQFSLARRGRVDVPALRKLVAYLRRERVDVLHAHKFGSNVWASVLGRAARVPVVVAHEHSWSFDRRLRRLIDGQLVGRLASACVAVSEADRARMIALEGIEAEKVIAIPNGFVPKREPNEGDLRRELGLSQTAPVIGTVAMLRPEKALETLIEAVALLLPSVPDLNLVIAGTGPSEGSLRAHASAVGVADRTHFLGYRGDVDMIVDAFDVGTITSDREGMPLFALECFAYGTPLVATAVGGLTELVDDGTNGLLVPPRDPPALAAALAELINDRQRRTAIAAAGRSRLEPFTMDNVAARIAALYERLLAGGPVNE